MQGVMGEVAGVLLVGDLTWRALKVRQIVHKLNQTCLILKIQLVHLRTCNQMPARFCDSDSDQNDGVLCVLCNENSPVDLPDSTVF